MPSKHHVTTAPKTFEGAAIRVAFIGPEIAKTFDTFRTKIEESETVMNNLSRAFTGEFAKHKTELEASIARSMFEYSDRNVEMEK